MHAKTQNTVQVNKGAVFSRQEPSKEGPAGTPEDTPITSTRYVWYVIALLSVVNLFSYMDRMALSILMPAIKTDLSLSDGQLGLLVGFAFFLFYAICGIPIARWADRGNRTNIITVTLVVWSVMTAFSGAAQNFWHLLLARIGLGAGEAGCIPAAESIIADYVPPQRRASAYALHAFGYSAGTMAGLLVAGRLGELIGWRWTFVAIGLPGIAVAMVVRFTLREPVRGASDGALFQDQHVSMGEAVSVLKQCRAYRRVVLFLVVNAFAYAGLVQWWPSFYERTFGISLTSVGTGLGIAMGAGSGVGTIIGGLLAHRFAQRDLRAPLKIGMMALSLAFATALGSVVATSVPTSLLLAFFTILLWCIPSGSVTATLFSVTRPHMRATASAITIFLMSVFGFGLGPFCVGLLSDVLSPALGVEALRYALLMPIFSVAGLVLCLGAVTVALPPETHAGGGTGAASSDEPIYPRSMRAVNEQPK